MSLRENYNHTLYASYLGYITQAIVNNFAPLLFLTFQSSYQIPLDKIALLVTCNFGVQLVVDLLASRYVDKIGYRTSVVAAHIFSAAGLVGLAILPGLLPDPFAGLLLSVVVYAIGGGLIEVLISPIVEACPTQRKESAMSLLHSFYCWGTVFVVLLSTAFFALGGIENWRILAVLWAIIPLINAVYFSRVPILTLDEGAQGLSLRQLLGGRMFWVMLLLMVCAGAAEQSVSQWASAFAESALGVSKTVGDLSGICAFAVLMGSARTLYARYGDKLPLRDVMMGSGVLCLASYLLISLAPVPVLSLIGCALCGFSVGVLWPGAFSISAKEIRGGGTAMFALLALAGDLGCSGGPTFVGLVSGAFQDDLKIGILAAAIFPVLLLMGLLLVPRKSAAPSAGPS